ncbi:SDR family oxidoreductase [Phaeobacter sp. 22II1-1F12B]|uniref:SDR family oxidoreductase n=1 Tax=Phaeobacter sp. 22II1-1F12B TaxID=1317111 RepID=UPI000B5293B2|nr:SDR family oxidoreductase [Phaeobacter sp. 22II1-1F12B]OWU80489.1 sugar dehydrogenase [Phaeobacter sp. 22II1-1F12B]
MRPVCVITGASGGIGAATARLAAARGYDLALSYNGNKAAAEAVAADARKAGARAEIYRADVAKPGDIEALFTAVDRDFGRIDALVNNAGVVDMAARVTDFTHDRLRRMFDINVIGAMLAAKEAVLRMQAQGSGGSIVNISSVAARLGSANEFVDYAASKAAIDTFTKGLANEVATDGIRVNSLRPGLIETEIHAKGGEPDRAERLAVNVPMKRVGTADEVADAVLYLLSDQASYVTGAFLDVSGGR